MDLKLLLATFAAVFVAELGDKTQLATMLLAAGEGATARWTVFAGAALALVASSALAVLGGTVVTRWISPMWLHRVAGVAFVVLGVVTVWRAGKGD